MSPYFWYNGYRGKQYKLFPYHKAGLLRFDDPGNMCYGATGKIMLSIYIPEPDRPGILEFAANGYAGITSIKKAWVTFKREISTMFKSEDSRSIPKFDDLLKETFKEIRSGMVDDPRDLKAVEYGYNSF